MTLANNHVLDFGEDGLRETVKCCKEAGLEVVGVGDDLRKAGDPLYLTKNGKTLAIVNCCEHEFSIATDRSAGANPLDPARQYYQIGEARNRADYVLVIVHGGHEHWQLPSPRMQETYRFFIDVGADAVVNHHQHCYSGYEIYNGKPIFYGLGNFCFERANTHNDKWNEGFMVGLDFNDGEIAYRLYPYVQCDGEAGVRLVEERSGFESKVARMNKIISSYEELRDATEAYYSQSVRECIARFQPGCRISDRLFRMGLLPSPISRKRLLIILNHIECEAHRDKELYSFRKFLKTERRPHA